MYTHMYIYLCIYVFVYILSVYLQTSHPLTMSAIENKRTGHPQWPNQKKKASRHAHNNQNVDGYAYKAEYFIGPHATPGHTHPTANKDQMRSNSGSSRVYK